MWYSDNNSINDQDNNHVLLEWSILLVCFMGDKLNFKSDFKWIQGNKLDF